MMNRMKWRHIVVLNMVNLFLWLGWTCLAAIFLHEVGLAIGCAIVTIFFLYLTDYSAKRADEEDARNETEQE